MVFGSNGAINRNPMLATISNKPRSAVLHGTLMNRAVHHGQRSFKDHLTQWPPHLRSTQIIWGALKKYVFTGPRLRECVSVGLRRVLGI